MVLKQLWGEKRSLSANAIRENFGTLILQRRSHWTQSLQLYLRNSPCDSSREKAWQTATIPVQAAKLPPTLQLYCTLKHRTRMKAHKMQNDGWRSPRPSSVIDLYLLHSLACTRHRPFELPNPRLHTADTHNGMWFRNNYMTENGKTALPNLLLRNRLSWLQTNHRMSLNVPWCGPENIFSALWRRLGFQTWLQPYLQW